MQEKGMEYKKRMENGQEKLNRFELHEKVILVRFWIEKESGTGDAGDRCLDLEWNQMVPCTVIRARMYSWTCHTASKKLLLLFP